MSQHCGAEFRGRFSLSQPCGAEFRGRFYMSRVCGAEFRGRFSVSQVCGAEFRGRFSVSRVCGAEFRGRFSVSQPCGAEFRGRFSMSQLCGAEFRGRFSNLHRRRPRVLMVRHALHIRFVSFSVDVLFPSAARFRGLKRDGGQSPSAVAVGAALLWFCHITPNICSHVHSVPVPLCTPIY